MFLKSKLLSEVPGIAHGFGTREEPIPGVFLTAWEEDRPRWKQVHGVAHCEVRSRSQECGEVDSVFTREPNIPIAVVTADCVPILLAHKNGKVVAAVHAGWRGTRAHIVREIWKTLQSQGEKASDWVAAIGPAIGPCCYEVSSELGSEFVREFSAAGREAVSPAPRILDLPAINAFELKSLGFGEVDLIRACTRCSGKPDQPTFHSYRREKGNIRQWSMIMRLT